VVLERRRSRSGSNTRVSESRWGPIGPAAVWTAVVVVFLPGASEPFCGPQGFEFLDCQELIAETAMEALRIPVLPWAAGFNVKSRYVHRLEPFLDRMSNKLRAVVATNMFGDSSFREKSGKGVDNVIASDGPRGMKGQAFSCVLVDYGMRTAKCRLTGMGYCWLSSQRSSCHASMSLPARSVGPVDSRSFSQQSLRG
jgi:hypothetical protein